MVIVICREILRLWNADGNRNGNEIWFDGDVKKVMNVERNVIGAEVQMVYK